ncbi:MAG: hypothetical protein Q7S27_05470 [Nanoarchaeota archaeon]|nr:hypothetical protein [Nanoarchaeota archaeon]
MTSENNFVLKINEILGLSGIGRPDLFECNSYNNTKDLRSKFKENIDLLLFKRRRNFLVFSGYSDSNYIFGRGFSDNYKDEIIDRCVEYLDESYASLNMNERIQEKIELDSRGRIESFTLKELVSKSVRGPKRNVIFLSKCDSEQINTIVRYF